VWVGGTAVLELTGILPLTAWHLTLPGVVLVTAVGLLWPGLRARRALLLPAHVGELAQALAGLPAVPTSGVTVRRTSAGYLVSGGATAGGPAELAAHYTLSHVGGRLPAPVAWQLATMILTLRHPHSHGQLVAAGPNLFHVLVWEVLRFDQSWRLVKSAPRNF
jgi:hypothetical protein